MNIRFLVWYSGHGIYDLSIINKTNFNDLETGQVYYSDTYCIRHPNTVGSEIRISLAFKWSKRSWVPNGPDSEWDLKYVSPTI